MNGRFIKYHPQSNTYVIKKRAYFDEDIVLDGNVIVGQEVNFWKDLKVSGKLDLGRGALVRGNVKADSALLCNGSRVLGKLDVDSDLFLLDNAKVRAVYCKGNVLARPGCFMGFIKAEGTLELVGKVKIRDVEPLTKVIVRAEDMSMDLSKDTFEDFSKETSVEAFEEDVSEAPLEDMLEDFSEEMPVEARGEEVSEDMLEDLLEDLLEDNSEGIFKYIPEKKPVESLEGDLSEGLLEDNSEDIFEYIPEKKPVESLEGDLSEGLLEDNSEDIFEYIPEKKPVESLEGDLSDDLLEDLFEDMSEDVSEDGLEDLFEESMDDKPWHIPEDTVEEIIHGASGDRVNEVENPARIKSGSIK